MYFEFFILQSILVISTYSKLINLKNVWMLPEDDYPVFYRYFNEQMTWFEAENVCNFHHGNLVTIKNESNFDVLKAYLKEFEINDTFWIGLNRDDDRNYFVWPDNEEAKNVQLQFSAEDDRINTTSTTTIVISKDNSTNNNQSMNCVAINPKLQFRWVQLSCDRPTSASFICEVNIPEWANETNGCLLTSIPSITIIYVLEDDVFELVSECGLQGTKSITCKDNVDRNELINGLKCDFDEDNMINNDSDNVTSSKYLITTLTSSSTIATQSQFQNMRKTTPAVYNVTQSSKNVPITTHSIEEVTSEVFNVTEISTEIYESSTTDFIYTTPEITTIFFNNDTYSHELLHNNSEQTISNTTIATNLKQHMVSDLPKLDLNQDYVNTDDKVIEIRLSATIDDKNITSTLDQDEGAELEMQVATVENMTIFESNRTGDLSEAEFTDIKPYFISRFVG